MNSRSHIGFWLILFLAGIFVTPYLVSGDAMRTKLVRDVEDIKRVLGPRIGGIIVSAATAVYDDTVGASGLRDGLDGMTHSDSDLQLAERVGSKLTVAAAKAADKYVQSLSMQIYAVMLRTAVIVAWIVLLLPLAIAVLVDGYSARAKKFETLGFQNPTAFSMSLHLAILVSVLPLLYLVVPIPVTPLFMPYWAVVAALPLSFAITHAQPILTR